MGEPDHTVHPTGWSVYDVTAQLSAVVSEETRLTCGEWKKKWHHRLRMGVKFLLNHCGDQRTLWEPSDSSDQNQSQRGDPLLQMAEASLVSMTGQTRLVQIKN